jgi:hypothetical protein
MSWKTWKAIGGIVLAVGACVGAFFLNALAWQMGFSYPENGLMPCHGWAFLILVPAWGSVLLLIETPPRKEKATGPRVWEILFAVIALFSMFFSCYGCYATWPGVVVVVLLIVVFAVLIEPKDAVGATWWLIGRAAVTAVLFMITWYLAATMLRQGIRGFGERMEAKVDDDRLIAWAEEVIAERKRQKDVQPWQNALAAEKIPDFMHDLMGGQPERTRVTVVLTPNDAYVTVATSVSQTLQITIRPSRAPRERGSGLPAWLIREADGFEWRAGIYVDTAGNFR